MPSHSETAWLHPVATPSAGVLPLARRLVGLLAFSGLALGILIAARGGCGERHPAEERNAGLSTLAPIMRTGPVAPLDAVRRDTACRAHSLRQAAPRS
ncbi:hypothetical protein SAMN03159339_5151 [Variovorax sp. 770b2]|nr:hypothetical protein SAMN03159339_5151 [Variovorax sp. 770b2]